MKINIKKNRNIKKCVLIGVCAILTVSSIYMTIENATSGIEVSNIRSKEIVLANQKRELEGTLIKTMSVSGLEVKSEEMGYIKPSVLVYVAPAKPVAQLP